MKLAYYPQKMPLKKPFVLSHGTFHHREALILELSVGEQKGYGEATVITYYGKRMIDFIERLEEQRDRIEALDISFDSPTPPKNLVIFEEEPFLQSALDCAVWDLWGKHQGIALHRHFAPGKASPKSSFTLSGAPDGISTSLERAEWPIYKIKLGSENDELILPILIEHSNQCEIRIDANGGWSPEEALKYCEMLVHNGITFIEQPVAPEYDEYIPTLAAETGAEIWADESAQNADSISHCAKYYAGINFKLMKSGGLTPVVREIALARELGLKVGLGCMTESSFGISALAQIAALADSLDMDGNLLLAEDPGYGAYIEKGKVVLPQEPGIGCRWRKAPEELHP
jgi:L-alanine-DL-glutamate epimerase-like enolase superfamily enzyme